LGDRAEASSSESKKTAANGPMYRIG
jgi:hypothetical protein